MYELMSDFISVNVLLHMTKLNENFIRQSNISVVMIFHRFDFSHMKCILILFEVLKVRVFVICLE